MSKSPVKTDVAPADFEEDVEKVVSGTIKRSAPPELQKHAEAALRTVLKGAQRSSIGALLVAAAIGFLAAMLFK